MRAGRITGRALAAALDVRTSTISEWRTGLYRPERERLAQLASLLGVPVSELLADDTGDVAGSPQPPANVTPNASALLGLAVGDPVAEMVRQGQAEAGAWVLEFAARLLEAGAQRLRQGVQRDQIIRAVEATEAVVTRQQGTEPAAPQPTPPTSARRPASAARGAPHTEE